MSNSVTIMCRRLRMSAPQKAVLMCIADRADDAGLAWPSIPGIGEWTCLSRTAVILAMKWLEQQGFVVVTKSTGQNNRCAIALDKIQAVNGQCATRTRTPDAPVRETYPPRTPDAPPPVRQADYTRAPDAPEASISIIQASEAPVKRKRAKAAQTPLPIEFGISSAVRDWATKKGFGEFLPAHLEEFTGWAKAKAAENANWDQAFMNSIRNDWGDVRKKATAQTLKRPATHSGFSEKNYREGATADGTFA